MLVLLLACATTHTRPLERGPIVYPVDPAFDGRVTVLGASMEYYAVEGKDDIAVWSSILENGPKQGSTAHGAATRWNIAWEWPDDGTCAPVTVTAELVVTFPYWEPPADAPAHAIGNWQRYVRALAVHEQGHVDRVRGVVEQMPGLLGAAGCDGVSTKGQEALALVDELNRAFDVETDSGRLQGASLFVPRTPPTAKAE